MKRKLLALACVLAVMALTFAACNRDGGGQGAPFRPGEENMPEGGWVFADDNPFAPIERANSMFPTTVINDNPIIDGGIFRLGIGGTAAIPGIFCPVHQISALDGDVRALFAGSMFTAGMDLHVDNSGSLVYTAFDRENQTITFTMMHEAYWHDGVRVTMDDLYFAKWVISHPDYQGTRWGPNFENIVGAREFRAGQADYISGMVLSDDKMTLTLHMIDFPFTISAFGWWSAPLPRHHWEGIPVSEMRDHPKGQYDVLGFGPFIIDNYVAGESVSFVRNENYWRGRPHLDGVVLSIVNPNVLPAALQEGLFDIAMPFPIIEFSERYRYMDNVQFLSNAWALNGNAFMGFRMGTWQDGEVYTYENPPLSETVRRAIMLSVDHGFTTEIFHGLQVPTGSWWFGLRNMQWIDTNIPTYNNFDPDEAERMLDAAGYLRGPDGFRTNPDGSELTIIYLALTGHAGNDAQRQMEIQNWADIGLRVEFFQGRQVATAVGTEVRMREYCGGVSNGGVHMWWFGWSLGANPTPTVMSRTTTNNQVRYSSERWDNVMADFLSNEMWDPAFLLETTNEWQWAMHDAGAAFPWTQSLTINAANNRVANFSMEITGNSNYPSSGATWLWGLTAPEPYVDTNR